MAVSLEESDYHGVAGQEDRHFLVFNWGVGGLGRFSITVSFFC